MASNNFGFTVLTNDDIFVFLQEEERERVKGLVLNGRIPLDNAPPEMAEHPITLIEVYCQKLIAERRAKVSKSSLVSCKQWKDR